MAGDSSDRYARRDGVRESADNLGLQDRRHLRQDLEPALYAERERIFGELAALRTAHGEEAEAERRRLTLHLRWVLEKLAELGDHERQ
jgi:hypothetical protein